MNTASAFPAYPDERLKSKAEPGHLKKINRQQPAAVHFWHIQLRDPGGRLFKTRTARFAFLNIWRTYIAGRYPTCAYVLIPGYFGCIIEVPEHQPRQKLMQALLSKLYSKLNGLFSDYLLDQLRSGIQLRKLNSVEECMHCTFDLHTLPQRHQISTDYRSYPFSSYLALSGGRASALKQTTVFDWFGGQLRFTVFHQAYFGWVKPQYGQDSSGPDDHGQVAGT
jgi:hypothetical protein